VSSDLGPLTRSLDHAAAHSPGVLRRRPLHPRAGLHHGPWLRPSSRLGRAGAKRRACWVSGLSSRHSTTEWRKVSYKPASHGPARPELKSGPAATEQAPLSCKSARAGRQHGTVMG
jgi:hypothetical protein